ncbi:MAG: methyltransferase domain-containing protein [Bacteriovoracaceae bacterium]
MKTFCAYFNEKKCHSCKLIELDYSTQLKMKEAKLNLSPLAPTFSSPKLHFRNKAKFTVTGTVQAPVIGLLGESNLDEGREILECPLHHPKINQILPGIKKFITLANLTPYQISNKTGELKGLILFYSVHSDEMYLRFVLRSKEAITRIKKYLPELQIPYLKCISANIQPIAHAILEGKEEIILSEKHFIRHQLKDISLTLTPQAFVQTNQIVAESLYQTAANWIEDLKINKFLELYCGQGAFSFFVSNFIKQGLGIEINAEAIKQATQTARSLNLNHLEFKCSDSAHTKNDIESFSPDLILVNPPRRGLSETALLLKETQSPYIIYSSCSYESLQEDLTILTNYKVMKAQIFDMFPHTEHFETLVLLQRL